VFVGGGHGRRRIGGRRLSSLRRGFVGLEEGVGLEHLLDFLLQLDGRQLQQPDRLLQLRRQRQMLRQAQVQRLLHSLKPSPR
jgi:hypothetical protein